MRMTGAVPVTRMTETKNAYKILVGKRERKRPLCKSRFRLEDNIIMDLRVTARRIGLDVLGPSGRFLGMQQ
jgi:hypothetical protein